MKTNLLLDVKSIKKSFVIEPSLFSKKRFIAAIDDVSFKIMEGEVVGLVGESGCGKTTLARLILNLLRATAGDILFRGKDIFRLKGMDLKDIRKNIQIIFQDPISSFNPRMKIIDSLKEPLVTHRLYDGSVLYERIRELLELVGLKEEDKFKYPHQFSAGQLQRIAIARAISLRPLLLVCDEALSSLDVSVQARIINLFLDIQEKFNMSFLFISHNLTAVSALSDRIMVMYKGNIVEIAPNEDLFKRPLHPYTKLLLKSTQLKDFLDIDLRFDSTSVENGGCKFYTRCPQRKTPCTKTCPHLIETEKDHYVACLDLVNQ